MGWYSKSWNIQGNFDLQFFRLQIWIRDSNKFIIWNFIWIICKERKIKFLKSKIWQLPFKDIEYLEIVKVQLINYFASRNDLLWVWTETKIY